MPREEVDALSLETLRIRLDEALLLGDCQVSLVTNQLFRLDFYAPHREDLEALTQWNALSLCQPSLLDV